MTGRDRQRKFILDPDHWPQWPLLPVKRRRESGFPDTGIVTPFGFDVYRANLFDGKSIERAIEENDCFEYETVDALLDAGWEVD